MRRHLFLLISLCLLHGAAWADLVLVANPRSGLEHLEQRDVVSIYMGRYVTLPSGQTAKPFDLSSEDALRHAFYRRLTNKTPAEISAYWSRLIFSGKAHPPETVPSMEAAIRHVLNDPAALAYVERSLVTDRRVRIVFELGDGN